MKKLASLQRCKIISKLGREKNWMPILPNTGEVENMSAGNKKEEVANETLLSINSLRFIMIFYLKLRDSQPIFLIKPTILLKAAITLSTFSLSNISKS